MSSLRSLPIYRSIKQTSWRQSRIEKWLVYKNTAALSTILVPHVWERNRVAQHLHTNKRFWNKGVDPTGGHGRSLDIWPNSIKSKKSSKTISGENTTSNPILPTWNRFLCSIIKTSEPTKVQLRSLQCIQLYYKLMFHWKTVKPFNNRWRIIQHTVVIPHESRGILIPGLQWFS